MAISAVMQRVKCVCRPCRDRPLGGRIFVCYRWADARGYTRFLVNLLEREFGSKRVFWDIKIPLGEDYRDTIRRELESCYAVLIVIGPNWVTVTDEKGRRRIDHARDQLRQEVELALESDARVRVIPVLVDGAPMPPSRELPESIARLAYRIAHELTPGHFESDVQSLIERIETPRHSRFTGWGDIRRKAPVWALVVHALWRPFWANTIAPVGLVVTGLLTGATWLLALALVLYVVLGAITLFDLEQARCVQAYLQELAETGPSAGRSSG